MFHKKKIIVSLLLAGSQLLHSAELEPVLVPTPRAKALATTATSRPFLAATRSQQLVDLAARGYTESEVAVLGQTGAGQPFATRILVRRPLVLARFSGRVVVELLNPASQYETAPLWGFSWEHFIRRGDAWVGVTVAPAAVATLKKFNAGRYATLNLVASPLDVCGRSQDGLAVDALAQVGALLRSASKENPLLDLNPQRLIVAGRAESGDFVTAFAITQHRSLRLGGDAPVFDGYLNVSGIAHLAGPCDAAIPRGVPYVAVLTEADMVRSGRSRADDVQSEGFRVHEIAGVEGAGLLAAGAPAVADLAAVGFAVGKTRCREPVMDLVMSQAMNAIWQQLDDLLVRKQPMENLPPLASASAGGTGGWRLPQVELPLAGRGPGHGLQGPPAELRQVCDASTGTLPRFDAATLKSLYRNRSEYLRRFNAAVDQAVLSRLLVKEDADALKAAAIRTVPTF